MATEKNNTKTKKADAAFAIFASHLPKRETMKKREFRAMVVEDMAKQLGITNKGTLGMYFAWSDQVITGRKAKVYSRGDGSRARKGSAQDAKTQKALNEAAAAFAAVGAPVKKAAKKKDDAGDAFVPTNAFGARL